MCRRQPAIAGPGPTANPQPNQSLNPNPNRNSNSPEMRPKIPLYIILLTYVNQAYEHAPGREDENKSEDPDRIETCRWCCPDEEDEEEEDDDDVADEGVMVMRLLRGGSKALIRIQSARLGRLSDKVKSLFEAQTLALARGRRDRDGHGNNLIGIKAGAGETERERERRKDFWNKGCVLHFDVCRQFGR